MSELTVRPPDSIYQIKGEIENGTFHGRWHFSFDEYNDPEYMHFGTLRVFNDDTLSPGAVWPLHPHREIEVVTYCAEGEFRHADHRGKGGILRKGGVQHTTVGKGMMHSEINNSKTSPMRFIQMWFLPSVHGLEPSVQQRSIEKEERTDRLLPLVSTRHSTALFMHADAEVYSCFLHKGNSIKHHVKKGRGSYLYVLEGDELSVNGHMLPAFGAIMATGALTITITGNGNSELLLIDVLLV